MHDAKVRKEKFRFERLQAELETLTEQMSDIVARSHLRASQIQITYLTSAAAEKRLELNNFIFEKFACHESYETGLNVNEILLSFKKHSSFTIITFNLNAGSSRKA
mgnify:CR=1 FL=1